MSQVHSGRHTFGTWVLHNVKHPVAARSHECNLCFDQIPAKVRYTTATLAIENEVQSGSRYIKLCPICRTQLVPPPPDLINSEETTERTYGMNLNNVASLIREDVVTINCRIIGGKTYTFKCLEEVAKTLSRGDYVVVDMNDQIQIVEVYDVHNECKIDIDSNIVYKWAFQKVDIDALTKLHNEDQLIAEKLKKHKRNSAREQVMAMFGVQDSKTLLEQLNEENKGE